MSAAETPITREGVEFAYRYLLDRPPENEKAYEYGLSAGTVETLKRWISSSPEYVQKQRAGMSTVLRRAILADSQAEPAEAPPSVGAGKPRIVFLHIMKTAGSSMRERLEQIAGTEPVWRRESDGRPGDVPQDVLARYRVLMGHFNIADSRHVPQPRRIFTVLREPRERLVSLYYFLHRHTAERVAEQKMEHARIARACSLEEFLTHADRGVRDSLQNVMTRALAGDYRVAGPNRYIQPWERPDQAISGPQMLAKALTNLLSLDFIAFVDRLEEDRPLLMKALGVPDLGPLPRKNTKDLIADHLEERPPPVVTPLAEKMLNRLTDLDRVLYRLARQHRGV